MRRASSLAVTLAAIALVFAACTHGRDSASGRLLTRGEPVPTSIVEAAPSADAPPTPAEAAPVVVDPDDPTPVIAKPRPPSGAVSRSSGGRPAPPARATAPPAPPKPVAFGNLAPPGALPKAWAVVIGVGDYAGGTHDTVGGRGDAAAVMTALQRAGWPADHILELVDGDATGGRIRQAMTWLVQHSAPDTFTYFHFSGHVCIPSTGPCGSGMHLWAHDNQFIADTDVGNVLRGLQGKAWVDIAGCEAAAFDKGISNADRLFTGSSTASEKSYEHPDWHESVWTGLSFDQGILQGQADGNGDHHVAIREAINFGAQRAPEVTRDGAHGPQHPVLTGGENLGGADLAEFAKMPPPPPPQQPPPNNGGGGGGGGGQPAPAPGPTCALKPVVKC